MVGELEVSLETSDGNVLMFALWWVGLKLWTGGDSRHCISQVKGGEGQRREDFGSLKQRQRGGVGVLIDDRMLTWGTCTCTYLHWGVWHDGMDPRDRVPRQNTRFLA